MNHENRNSEPGKPKGESTSQRFLNFTLGREEFAIPLLDVKEVIASSTATPLPGVPPYFLGFINLRGLITSVVDLPLKLKMPKTEKSPENAVIILDLGGASLGVTVDSINSVIAIESKDISVPDIDRRFDTQYLSGIAKVGEKLVLLLDVRRVLDVEDRKILAQTLNQSAA